MLEAPQQEQPTVLIVDDERVNRVMLAELLGQIANNTGRMSESIGKNASSAASWEAGAKPRSTRSQLVKPGY